MEETTMNQKRSLYQSGGGTSSSGGGLSGSSLSSVKMSSLSHALSDTLLASPESKPELASSLWRGTLSESYVKMDYVK